MIDLTYEAIPAGNNSYDVRYYYPLGGVEEKYLSDQGNRYLLFVLAENLVLDCCAMLGSDTPFGVWVPQNRRPPRQKALPRLLEPPP